VPMIRRKIILQTNTFENRLRRRESFKRLINLTLSAVCLALEIGIFAYHWQVHFQWSIVEELRNVFWKNSLLEITFYGVLLFFFSLTYGGMRLGYLKNVELIFSQVFSTLIANILIYAELSIMARELFVPNMFIAMMVEQVAAVIIYVNIANKIYQSVFPPRELMFDEVTS